MNVYVEGTDAVMEKLNNLHGKLRNNIRRAFRDSGNRMVFGARNRAPRDSGDIAEQIGFTLDDDGLTLYSKAKHSAYVEWGTRPHWPPMQAIASWAERHGIPTFLLARHIARYGTAAHPFMTPAVEEERPKLLSRLMRVWKGVL